MCPSVFVSHSSMTSSKLILVLLPLQISHLITFQYSGLTATHISHLGLMIILSRLKINELLFVYQSQMPQGSEMWTWKVHVLSFITLEVRPQLPLQLVQL